MGFTGNVHSKTPGAEDSKILRRPTDALICPFLSDIATRQLSKFERKRKRHKKNNTRADHTKCTVVQGQCLSASTRREKRGQPNQATASPMACLSCTQKIDKLAFDFLQRPQRRQGPNIDSSFVSGLWRAWQVSIFSFLSSPFGFFFGSHLSLHASLFPCLLFIRVFHALFGRLVFYFTEGPPVPLFLQSLSHDAVGKHLIVFSCHIPFPTLYQLVTNPVLLPYLDFIPRQNIEKPHAWTRAPCPLWSSPCCPAGSAPSTRPPGHLLCYASPIFSTVSRHIQSLRHISPPGDSMGRQ